MSEDRLDRMEALVKETIEGLRETRQATHELLEGLKETKQRTDSNARAIEALTAQAATRIYFD